MNCETQAGKEKNIFKERRFEVIIQILIGKHIKRKNRMNTNP